MILVKPVRSGDGYAVGRQRTAKVHHAAPAPSSRTDPLLQSRLTAELAQIARVRRDFAKAVYLLAFQHTPPIGAKALRELTWPAVRDNPASATTQKPGTDAPVGKGA